ncbi:MAG: AmmeMemoRadiSam system protein B [Candidatus Dadabacteria bacterium]|nr:AmmeMemoRadiSam system protein B [Candidatus Dadabacteria bacterium]NIQ15554.1 AmmeMemoRadiSam system protein B [Candidatus Dadabacteria bacterium]
MSNPILDNVDIIPAQHNGETIYYLKDIEIGSNKLIPLTQLGLYIISHFDGNYSTEQIQKLIDDRINLKVDLNDINSLVNLLDENYLLINQRSKTHKNKLEKEYLESYIRPSAHAGHSYPDNKDELNDLIENFYKNAGLNLKNRTKGRKVKGIISPHIDFNRGGKSFSKAYYELSDSTADTFLIFGTSHYPKTNNPFILTKKPFNTPYGTVDISEEFINELEKLCDWDIFDGEISHKNEHSLEFQIVFLQHLFKNEKEIKIIPVLCNSYHDFVQDGKSPYSDYKISKFLQNIRHLIKISATEICMIAGVDMAHVGKKFGDNIEINNEILEWIEKEDKDCLNHVKNIDPDSFYNSIEKNKDNRKICGLSSIYSMLKTINADNCKILDYDKALEPDTGSVVTFASAVFY